MNNDIITVIKNQKRGDKLSHAYLIETNDFDAFNEKLKIMLKLLLCDDKEYCDKCQNCHYIDNFEHPNVLFISPEKSNIKINQIDNLRRQFNTKATYAKYNIYVIYGAETLNQTAGNALLKFLEEPEENIIGILLTNNRSLVLPTILSRCQTFTDLENTEVYSEEVKEVANKIESYTKSLSDMVDYSKMLKDIEDKNIIKNAFSYLLTSELKKNNNVEKIMILKEIVEKMRYNVNIDLLLLNYLIRMREINE